MNRNRKFVTLERYNKSKEAFNKAREKEREAKRNAETEEVTETNE